MSVIPDGNRIKINFDDAPQGVLELNKPFGKLIRVSAMDGLNFQSPAVSSTDAAALTRKRSSALEKKLWDLSDSWKHTSGVRNEISFNGVWRTSIGKNYAYAPAENAQRLYSRVPGNFRSTWFHRYVEKNGKLSPLPVELAGGDTAGWYQRTFTVPPEWKGKRIFLHFSSLNADYGRVYLKGKLIDSFTQKFKNSLAIPNERRIDTPVLSKTKMSSRSSLTAL